MMIKSIQRPGLAIILALALSVTALIAGRVLAQDREGARSSLPRTMQRQQADWEPAQNLEPMTMTPCDNGFAGSYPCNNIDLLAFMPLSTIGGGQGNDIWGWTDPMTGKEYALMGRTNGTAFVDISDPVNPIYLGNLPSHSGSSAWRDIKVYEDHAFIVADLLFSHGMQVFDLTQLRNVTNPPVTFNETAHYDDFGSAHNLAINEDSGFAYAVGSSTCNGGLHMVNIQNPTNPTFAGCFSSDGYTHDTQCVIYQGPDTQHQGKEICFSSNEDTVTIVDVTNKANPIQLSRTGYSGSAYTHQGWLTDDHRYFLFDDELDESSFGHNTRTRVLDVSNLDAPVLVGWYDGATPAIDHNLFIRDGMAFESNYRAGLRIIELTDLSNANLTELAYFDVYPSSDSPSFNGTWSNYPYFESGVVVVSGIEQGLFVLQPTLAPDFTLATSDDALVICDPGADGTTLALDARGGYVGDVRLSALNLPPGATAAFLPNPVPVPGSSDMDVTVSGTPAGTYPFLVNGTDGTVSHELEMTLDVFDGTPARPTLIGPADGATSVDHTPTFSWTAVDQADTYSLFVATAPDPGSIVYTAEVEGTSHVPTTPLDPLATYFWGVRASNPCGNGALSNVFDFTTADIPPVLVVDDDDNSPDVRASYADLLDDAGVPYDVWDTANSDNEPDSATLQLYDFVIWFTGAEFGGSAGPGPASETALATFLESGDRCFFLSSQDYLYDRGLTPFMQSYLGAGTFNNDVGHSQVTGELIYESLGTISLNYPYNNFSDEINPAGPGTATVWSGNHGSAAIGKKTATYATMWLGFPLEAMPNENSRAQTLARFFASCR